ncbi:MAG: hypothetical protein QOD67_3502 [Caballeronia sp.]|jgi:hypothetical protein|nr:hypothetical protein [Caballeronia sp.]
MLEYRRGLWRYVDVTASYIHEEGKIQSRHDGVAAQFWATRSFFDDKLKYQSALGPTFPSHRTMIFRKTAPATAAYRRLSQSQRVIGSASTGSHATHGIA